MSNVRSTLTTVSGTSKRCPSLVTSTTAPLTAIVGYAPSSRGLVMAEDKEGPKEQFTKLRPVCVALMQERTVEAVRAVQEVVSKLDAIHPHLLEYVLLPFRTTLHRSAW